MQSITPGRPGWLCSRTERRLVHTEGVENLPPHVLRERDAGGAFDDECEKYELGIAVAGYPLDSGSPHRLWFSLRRDRVNDPVVRDRVDGHCLLRQAVEEHATAARPPAIEAEGELIQVVVEVLMADGSLVGSHQPSLGPPHRPCLAGSTARAAETIRPPQPGQIRSAIFVGPKVRL